MYTVKTMSLGRLFHETAQRQLHKTAIICRDQSLTYQQLDDTARALARRLLSDGLRLGDRVGVHWANSVECVQLLLACFHAGLIALPINLRLKTPEVAYIMEHSGATVWFSQPELAPIAVAAAAGLAQGPPIHTELPPGLPGPDLPDIDPSMVAAVMYTSGTTARPKGVTHTHASLLAAVPLMHHTGLHGDHTVLIMVSVMHASGLICLSIPTLTQGGTCVLLPRFDAAEALDTIERRRCSYIGGLPAMMQFVVEEQSQRLRDVRSVEVAIAGGDTVPLKLQERFQLLFGVPLREIYGMTESVPVTCNVPGAMRPGSVGRTSPGVQLRVLDLIGRDLPDGQTGELAFLSSANFSGYWNDPRNTADALVDGWVYSGDLGHRDSDGFYWFDGRKKEIIVRCGSNISPQEVEEALYQHPAILEAGVIGTPHEIYGELVVACVTLREGHTVGEEEICTFARTRLADYKVPERIIFIEEMPKGITGKVQRRALKELAAGTAKAQAATD
jgi:long-chain acyl-CoA synthetase